MILAILLIVVIAYALYRVGREHGEVIALEECNELLDDALSGIKDGVKTRA